MSCIYRHTETGSWGCFWDRVFLCIARDSLDSPSSALASHMVGWQTWTTMASLWLMASLVCTPFTHITFLDFPGDLNRSLASSYPSRPLLILTPEDYQGKGSRLPCDFSFLKQRYSTNLVFTNTGWLGYVRACTASDRSHDGVTCRPSQRVTEVTECQGRVALWFSVWLSTGVGGLVMSLTPHPAAAGNSPGIPVPRGSTRAVPQVFNVFHHHFPVWEFSLCRFWFFFSFSGNYFVWDRHVECTGISDGFPPLVSGLSTCGWFRCFYKYKDILFHPFWGLPAPQTSKTLK